MNQNQRFHGFKKTDIPDDGGIYIAGHDDRYYAVNDLAPSAQRQPLWPMFVAGGLALIAIILALAGFGVARNKSDLNRADVLSMIGENSSVKQAVAYAKSALEVAMKAEGDSKTLSARVDEAVKTSTTTATTVAMVSKQCKEVSSIRKASVAKKTHHVATASTGQMLPAPAGTVPCVGGSGPCLPGPASSAGPAASSDGMPLLGHDHLATASNPKPCVISSGDGAGLPPYCAGFSVQARHVGESKNQWLVRVGGGGRPGDTGLYQKAGFR